MSRCAEPPARAASRRRPAPVRVDIKGIDQRILALGVPAGDYSSLTAGPAGSVFYLETPRGGGQAPLTLHRYQLRERRAAPFLEGIRSFTLSGDGKKLLYRADGNRWGVVVTDRPAKVGEGPIDVTGLDALIDPRAEWAQIFRETWRIQREYFYDATMHGADWQAVYDKYRPLVPFVAHRADLGYLIAMVGGELMVGHSYISAPAIVPDGDPVSVGMLGADYAIENGRYRIRRIYTGENWNPELQAPLSAPGMQVSEGDYLLEVNGKPLAPPANIYQIFEGTAGRQTLIRVNSTPSLEGSRVVTVVPVASEDALRTRAWIENNRRLVDKLSGGRLAYVWLPNTGMPGYTSFNRLLLRAAEQGRRGHRRALQPGRHGGGLHRQRAGPEADGLLRAPRRQAVDVADGGHLRPEGDDHQRVGRLGRRRAAVLLQAAEDRAAGRHAHVGRAGRHPRHSRDDRRRRHHRAVARVLRSQWPVGGRERGRRARHRGRDHAGRRGRGPRPAARTRRAGSDEAAGEDSGEARAASGADRSHEAQAPLAADIAMTRSTRVTTRIAVVVASIVAIGLGGVGLVGRQPAAPRAHLDRGDDPDARRHAALHTDLHARQASPTPLPIVFQRTPYGVGQNTPAGVATALVDLPADGYIIVLQDIRGRFKSEGQFVMLRQPRDRKDPKAIDESTDTYDTIEWLLKNVPGNNGRVGMVGTSYPAWLAVMGALDPHPALKAIVPKASPADMWLGDDFHHNGAFRLSYGLEYAYMMESSKEMTPAATLIDRYDTYDWYLELGPLSNANRRYFRESLPTWNDFVRHPDYDAFWKRQAFAPWLNRVTVPTLNVAGWWDQEDFYGPIKIYELLEKHDTKRENFLVVGPWNHGGWSRGTGRTLGRIDFGSETATHYRRNMMATFLAHYLKDQGAPPASEALTFRTGANEWTQHDAWPPVKNVTPRRLYFQEDGKLAFTAPPAAKADAFDTYVSDPHSPVPYRPRPITLGRGWSTWLVEDQRFVHGRPDVRT